FSSRRRHTRWPRDWSSDVCSSDLLGIVDRHELRRVQNREFTGGQGEIGRSLVLVDVGRLRGVAHVPRAEVEGPHAGEGRARVERSEERRVGKECRSRWWTWQWKHG